MYEKKQLKQIESVLAVDNKVIQIKDFIMNILRVLHLLYKRKGTSYKVQNIELISNYSCNAITV